MRIGLINYEYPGLTDNCGGGGKVTKLLADGLQDRGHEVRICTDNGWSPSDSRVRGPRPGGHYVTFPIRSYSHTRSLVEWADVVNGHFSVPSSLLLPALCRRHDTPLVVTVMGSDVYNPVRFGAVRPVLNVLNRRIAAGADSVLAPSTDMAARMPMPNGHWPDVVHYGIDADRWRWRERTLHDPVRVLSVCRLVGRKNLGTAIEAVDRFAAAHGAVEYHIVGTGPEQSRLAELAADTDHATVEVRGYVDDLQAAYDWADCFFLPTVYEAFGMVFLEALASGLPVVTSTGGGQTDIVTPDVGWANASPGDAAAFAEGLSVVLGDYHEYQRATEGYVAERFSIGQMVDDYERELTAVTA